MHRKSQRPQKKLQVMAVLSRTALQCGTRDAIESAAANCQSRVGNQRSGQWTSISTFRVCWVYSL